MAHSNSRKKAIANLVDTTVTLDIEITKDLEILCNIYKLTPEEVLQKFSLSAIYETMPALTYKPTILFMFAYRKYIAGETDDTLDAIFLDNNL